MGWQSYALISTALCINMSSYVNSVLDAVFIVKCHLYYFTCSNLMFSPLYGTGSHQQICRLQAEQPHSCCCSNRTGSHSKGPTASSSMSLQTCLDITVDIVEIYHYCLWFKKLHAFRIYHMPFLSSKIFDDRNKR